jgi:hypothetical protein
MIKAVCRGLNWTVSIGWLATLVVSTYPGASEDFLLFVALVTILGGGCLGVVGMVAVVLVSQRGELDRLYLQIFQTGLSKRQIGVMALISGLAAVLLYYQIPLRLAFGLSQPAFDAIRQQAPIATAYANPDREEMQLHRAVGLYQVDEYARDRQGGTYFRVYSTHFFEETSYGFAYRPNQNFTPFGKPSKLAPLSGDWYWFKSSIDWF